MLVGYNVVTGQPAITLRIVDVPGAGGGPNPEFVPKAQLQRPALALDGREIVIAFGSEGRDCGHYHGWVVASRDDGSGPLLSFMTGTALQRGAAIWMGGGGPVVGSRGDIYVTTGNGDSTTSYDDGNSIIELNRSLLELDHYAPSTWASDNHNNLDLGSDNPMCCSRAGCSFNRARGFGYLVSSATGRMGGTGVDGQPDPSVYHAKICRFGWGDPAYHAGTTFVPCGDPAGTSGGLIALAYNRKAPSFSRLWEGPTDATAPPIVAAGLVWVVSVADDVLYGLNPSTGKVMFQVPLAGAEHFTSPSAGGGRLFVSAGQTVEAFVIAASPER